MKYVYAPGCALMAYDPVLAERMKEVAVAMFGQMDTLLTCCFHKPALEEGICIVTPCATCASRYAKLYPDCEALFLPEAMAESQNLELPDYEGLEMSIQDTCASRTMPEAQEAVRTLLRRMNIVLVEPQHSGAHARCCGQLLYGKASAEKMLAYMRGRAEEMPRENVAVYCASCIAAISAGGRKPRYLPDLVFGRPTNVDADGVEGWNARLGDFREAHRI